MPEKALRVLQASKQKKEQNSFCFNICLNISEMPLKCPTADCSTGLPFMVSSWPYHCHKRVVKNPANVNEMGINQPLWQPEGPQK